jgi:hypothetical protein
MLFGDLEQRGGVFYEDWRQPVDRRVNDLLSQMTLAEKAGMLLIDTLNAEQYGRMPVCLRSCLTMGSRSARSIYRMTWAWLSRRGS